MAERTVSVRLKALVDDYKRAMGQASAATKDVASKAQALGKLGASTANLGDSLTRNVTLPIVAVGAAAVKMSADFDKSFQTMHQLAGVSADEIEGLKESVLGLAGETGKAPTELAEALYFLRSSGLDGAAAMEALEMSAKASAAGMGSTVAIADAVSSAMNAYADAGLTAAEATDVLVATAREGKAEPAELASQMGRLLPMAAELGISFADVGAAVAVFSKQGANAAESTTLMSNLMSKLLRPSQQAREQLESVGISLDDIRSIIAERGLLGAVVTLQESLGESAFRLFWEDVQATNAALMLVGGNMEATEGIFESLNNAAGATDEAFAKWAQTMGAENARAWADFQIAMIRLGDILAPIAADILSFAAQFLEAFSKLPGPVQTGVLALLGFAAALGPIMSVGGRVVQVATSLYGALLKIAVPAGTVEGAFTGAATGAMRFSEGMRRVAGAGATLGILGVASHLISDLVNPPDVANVTQLERALLDLAATGQVTGELADAMGGDMDKLADAMHRVAEPGTSERILDVATNIGQFGNDTASLEQARQRIDDVDKALASLQARDPEVAAVAFQRIAAAMEETGISASQVEGLFDDYGDALAETETSAATAEGGIEGVTGAFDQQTAETEQAIAALEEYANSITAMSDPLFGLNAALQQNRDAQAEVTAKELELIAARESGDPMAVAVAEQALTDARIAAGESAFGVAQAEATLAAALQQQPGLIANVNSMLDGFVAQGLITESEALLLADRFGVLAERVESVPEQAGIDVSETGATETTRSIRSVERSIEDVPRSHNTRMTETGSSLARRSIRGVEGAVEDVPRSRNTSISTSGTAPARRQLYGVRDAGYSIPGRRGTAVYVTGYGAAISHLAAVTSQVNSIPRSATISIGFRVYGEAEANRARALAGRASGGPVAAGRAYLVGEKGPEILVMGSESGYVHANSDLDNVSMANIGGGGTQVNYMVDLRGALLPNSAEVEKAVFRAIRSGGERGRPLSIRGRRL